MSVFKTTNADSNSVMKLILHHFLHTHYRMLSGHKKRLRPYILHRYYEDNDDDDDDNHDDNDDDDDACRGFFSLKVNLHLAWSY